MNLVFLHLTSIHRIWLNCESENWRNMSVEHKIIEVIEVTQLKWVGHLKRMRNSRIRKIILEWNTEYRRRKSSSREHWMQNYGRAKFLLDWGYLLYSTKVLNAYLPDHSLGKYCFIADGWRLCTLKCDKCVSLIFIFLFKCVSLIILTLF